MNRNAFSWLPINRLWIAVFQQIAAMQLNEMARLGGREAGNQNIKTKMLPAHNTIG